jgi:hypothetical protein
MKLEDRASGKNVTRLPLPQPSAEGSCGDEELILHPAYAM